MFALASLLACLLAATPAAAATAVDADSLAAARASIRQSRFAEGETVARRALARLESAAPADSLAIADAMELIAEALWRGGHAAGTDAAALAGRALGIRERVQGAGDPAVATTLFQLANVLRRTADYPGARAALERSVRIRDRSLGPEHPLVAQSLNSLGNLLREMGALDAADSSYRRALAIREKSFGPEATEVGQTLNGLGMLTRDRGHEREALPMFERVLAIQQRALGPEDPEVAVALENLGAVRATLGDTRAARDLYDRALAIRERRLGPDHPVTAGTADNLGLLLMQDGRFAEAESLLQRALAARRHAYGDDHPDVATSLEHLGNLHVREEDFAAAIAPLERALAIRVHALGESTTAVAESKAALGAASLALGDLPRARRLLVEALGLDERLLGARHEAVANVLLDLARTERALDHLAAALRLAGRALEIRQASIGPETQPVAECEIELALELKSLGRPREAARRLTHARTIQERELGADHPALATIHDNLAGVELDLREWKESRQSYGRALAILRGEFGTSSRTLAYALHDLSVMLLASGDSAAAFDTALAAARIARREMRRAFRMLPEREALALGATTWGGFDLVMTLAARSPDGSRRRAALDALIRSRALVLDEMAMRRRREAHSNDAGIARRFDRLRRANERLSALRVSARRAAGASDEIAAAVAERDAAEREIAAGMGAEAAPEDSGVGGLDAVRAALPPGTALVSFVRHYAVRVHAAGAGAGEGATPEEYSAFVLAPGASVPRALRLGLAKPIDALVLAWRREASRGLALHDSAEAEAAYRAAGLALRRAVWDPIAVHLGGSTRAFIVADGELNLVNLATLPAAPGHYLVESTPTLHSLSAERDITRDPLPAESAPRLLAIGAPSFDASPGEMNTALAALSRSETIAGDERVALRGGLPDCGEFANVRFPPLPGAGREIESIARQWRSSGNAREPGSVTLLAGPSASEAAFRREAPRASWLHIATHGFFLSGSCAPSDPRSRGIGMLATSGGSMDAGGGDPAEHPLAEPAGASLRLSGLALAGANRRATAAAGQDDGILTAEEISTLDLSTVRWAVLSACETGLGEVRTGEGVLGLRRAFVLAGARTLITSLWPISDAATLSFMDALYEARLDRGLEADEAMRAAAVAELSERRRHGQSTHPFYWGGFVASGDWR